MIPLDVVRKIGMYFLHEDEKISFQLQIISKFEIICVYEQKPTRIYPLLFTPRTWL